MAARKKSSKRSRRKINEATRRVAINRSDLRDQIEDQRMKLMLVHGTLVTLFQAMVNEEGDNAVSYASTVECLFGIVDAVTTRLEQVGMLAVGLAIGKDERD